MSIVSLATLRARSRAGLVLASALIVAVTAFALCAILASLAATTADATRDALSATGTTTELVLTPAENPPELEPALQTLVERLAPLATLTATDDGWTLTVPPDVDVATARAQLAATTAALDETLAGTRVDVTGGLSTTLAELERGTLAVSSITPVPVVMVAVFAAIALARLARLLGESRAAETVLLRSRGASRFGLTMLSASEAALAGLPATVIGAIAALLLPTVGAGDVGLWFIAGAVWLLQVLIAALVGWFAAGRTSTATRSLGAGRGAGAGVAGAAVALAAAAVATWQLRQAGSALVPAAGGGLQVDLAGVLAPTLVLLAGGLAAVLVIGPLARLAQRPAARSAGLGPVLALRQLGRRSGPFHTAVLLAAVAVAAAVFAAGYASSWSSLSTAAAEQSNGAQVRARLADQVLSTAQQPGSAGIPGSDAAATVASINGVRTATPVLTAPLRVGSDPAALIAMDASTLPEVMLEVGRRFDTATAAKLLASPPPGIPLASESIDVTVALVVGSDSGPSARARITAWVCDDAGDCAPVPLGNATPGQTTLHAETTGTRLLAVDAELADSPSATVRIAGAVTSSTPLALTSGAPLGRAMATPEGPRLDAIVSQPLAERYSLGVGDDLVIQFDGLNRTATARIGAIEPAIPGAALPRSVLVSLPALSDALLRAGDTAAGADEVWASASDPEAAAAAVRDQLDATVTTTALSPAGVIAAPTAPAVWAGVIAAMLLALVAIGAIVASLSSARREETGVLRALGMDAGAQARGRLLELGSAIVAGLVLGGVIGLLAVALTIGPLVRGAVAIPADTVTLTPTIDAVALGIAAGAFIIALAAMLLIDFVTVRRQAATATPGEVS